MELEDLHAVHAQASVSAAGDCRMQPDGSCRLNLTRLAADQVQVDQDLLAALPGRMGEALARYPLSGPFNLLGKLGLTVQQPTGGALPETFGLNPTRLAATSSVSQFGQLNQDVEFELTIVNDDKC